MDRWDKSYSDRRQGLNLLMAAGLIKRFYHGPPANDINGLYEGALRCFETLIDISINPGVARALSASTGIDADRLMQGADQIISCLHFNKQRDFYIALGLRREASPDEIRNRWKRLMLLYHPDRFQDSGNQTDYRLIQQAEEKAKVVNEAYNMLKDTERRRQYDRTLNPNENKDIHADARANRLYRYLRPLHSAGYDNSASPVNHIKVMIPKIITISSVVISILVIGIIFLLNQPVPPPPVNSEHMENNKAAANNEASMSKTEVKGNEGNPAYLKEMAEGDFKEKGKGGSEGLFSEQLPRDKKTDGGNNIIKSKDVHTMLEAHDSHNVRPPIPEPQHSSPVSIEGKVEKTLQKDTISSLQNKTANNIKANKDIHEGNTKENNNTVQRPQPAPLQITEAAEQPIKPITRSEAKLFIKTYLSAYERGNIDSFMRFFSKDAVENGMDIQAMKEAYNRCFKGNENHYRLDDININDLAGYVLVSGNYRIDRLIVREDRWLHFSGRITLWLQRDNGGIKIVRLEHD